MSEKIDLLVIILFAIALLVATAIVILFTTFNNKKNKLIQEQLEKELNQQKKLHQIELNSLRNQLNPHFVHNSLNAIQYYIQQNDVETSEDYLTKFSKLMRLFFDYSRKENILISEEILLLRNYLDIEKLRFEEKLNFTINVDPKLDVDDTEIPAMMLQPIVENAINHGLFHKKGNGIVSIEFIKKNEVSFLVIITDDGVGINTAQKMNFVISKHKESHSTHVLEDRLILLKESNQWQIDYSITDRSELSKATGTEVKLLFKQLF
ncbi:MAG: histidine kinase [Flavobacteriaceae bacterium]